MAHTPDEQALKSLQLDVDAAVDLLRTLRKTKASHLVGTSQELPAEELQHATGLAFVFSTKVGFIGSFVTGHGFLIKKTASGWSAPVLLSVKSIGIGAVVGAAKASSLAVLDTEHAVHNFLHTQASLDSDMTVAVGPAGRKMHAAELSLTHPAETFDNAVYSVAQGAMVDVSFQGVTVSVNHQGMQKLYGKGVKEEEVLSGSVQQLQLVEALATEIRALSQSGTAPAPRKA